MPLLLVVFPSYVILSLMMSITIDDGAQLWHRRTQLQKKKKKLRDKVIESAVITTAQNQLDLTESLPVCTVLYLYLCIPMPRRAR